MSDELTGESTIADLAELWLAEKQVAGIAANTLRGYRGVVDNQIVPAIGLRPIASCRTSVIDRVIKTHAETGATVAKLRNALRQMFALAVRHDVLAANPVDQVARIRRSRRSVAVLTPAQVGDLRAHINRTMALKRCGPPMTDDLRDIVDLLLATGCRIGEILALTYDAVDLASDLPTLTVSGTVVTETGRGTFRQPWPKTDAGHRVLALPPFGVNVILRRQVEKPANPINAVFATRTGIWHQVANLETKWGRLVHGTEFDWVTFHVFRKSVATAIDLATDTRAAAAQLGHSSEAITAQYYVAKAKQAPDLREHLQVFGADRH
ncbi:putative phage integrase [Marmoricola endophyticus]|uniref:Phage integrase n=1 Tax=Marmoricola endophyticus TaxID=2040280 RepID=A0A917BAY1_9ACTN|nr:tyrosine-type recombinase/integrase [Marmoricola endophyticus]GGF35150.1 putative phage integrase [Marmoricola endophyticus]